MFSRPDWPTYADATIFSGNPERDPESADTCTNPVVVFEVLNPSRDTLREHYLQIESLRDYVFLDFERPHAEQWTRTGDGRWKHRVIEPDGEIVLASVGHSFALRDLYNFSTTSPSTYAS